MFNKTNIILKFRNLSTITFIENIQHVIDKHKKYLWHLQEQDAVFFIIF